MRSKHIIYLLTALIVVLVSLTILMTRDWQETVARNVQQIKSHVARQDSLILDLQERNSDMRAYIRESDSIQNAQTDTIKYYKQKIDSMSVVIDFLDRADLSDRYGPKRR